jgi:hypothetical protein
LEEEVGGLGFEGDVADFVDDEQRDPPESGELDLEPSLGVSVGEAGDPFGGVANATRWPAWQARMDSPMARWVLPVPGGPKNTTLARSAMKSRVPRCSTVSRLSERWWS